MITRVLDQGGNVLHDCEREGCEVSWDGIKLGTGKRVEGHAGIPDGYERVADDTVRAPASTK